MRKVLAVGTTALMLVAIVAVAPAQNTQPETQPTGLPDLAMHKLADVKASAWRTDSGLTVKRRWAIRFTTMIDNVGPGHFIIHAHRASTGSPCTPDESPNNRCEKRTMAGDQIVNNADGTQSTYPGVAVVYFDEHHFHWHLRYGARYQLRSANGRRIIVRDRKTGFCFGDRVPAASPPAPEQPGLEDDLVNCLYGSTTDPSQDGRRALELTEGISAGWSDIYRSFQNGNPLQGQELEITKLKAGRYLLVNQTNVQGNYHEITRANDTSSVLFKLSWRRVGRTRVPKVKVLRYCTAKPRCAHTA